MRTPPIVFALLLITLAGCANQSQSSLRASTDRMSAEEIMSANRGTLYEVLELLRPQWLRARSGQSVNRAGGIVVYLDDVRLGDIEALRTLPARDIDEIRRYTATSASQRWGPGHSDGVLEIRTLPR